MQQTASVALLTAVASAAAGPQFDVNKSQDVFVILPVTSGTVSMTMVVEVLNPDGVNWHQVATVAYTTAASQPVILLSNLPCIAIRARVSVWTSGTINCAAVTGSYGRD
jgi:hypothetical protein